MEKTITECKNEVALKYGFKDWLDFDRSQFDHSTDSHYGQLHKEAWANFDAQKDASLIEKAAEKYSSGLHTDWETEREISAEEAQGYSEDGFKAGANWQKERESAELTRANARIEELTKALQDLVDLQNGPPLPTYEKDFNEVMERCNKLLEKRLIFTVKLMDNETDCFSTVAGYQKDG